MNASSSELPDPLVITEGVGNAYKQDLHLALADDGTLWAAWIMSSEAETAIQWRTIREGRLSGVRTVRPREGHPCSPKVLPSGQQGAQLLWAEYADQKGTIFGLDVPDSAASARPVLKGSPNLGQFSCDWTRSGDIWLATEVWREDRVAIRVTRSVGNGWQTLGEVATEASFIARPVIRAGTCSGALLSWDEYGPNGYRVATAFLDDQGCPDAVPPAEVGRRLCRSADIPVPRSADAGLDTCGARMLALQASGNDRRTMCAPSDATWQTLSTVAQSEDGGWYLAYSTNELTDVEGGALGHHSEIRVARFHDQTRTWQPVDAVDIDDCMNPWMAAYVGRRRQPHLIPRVGGGVWLLWEMKQDPESMSPSLGQLWCKPIVSSDDGEPFVAVDGRCWFVPAQSSGLQSTIYVASKTQPTTFDIHLDYLLHQVTPDAGIPSTELRSTAVRSSSIHRASPSPDASTDDYQLFFGDPHLHSWLSGDLDGEPDEAYHFARDVAKLDFAALTDNDYTRFTEPLRPGQWQQLRRLANFFDDPGRFTALLGWEYTKIAHPARPNDITSHRCVLFPGSDGPVHSWHDGTDTPRDLIAALKGTRCLLHKHHQFPLDLTDDELERNVEICSGWGNWMLDEKYVAGLHDALRSGLKFGFFGASDNHERNPGLGGPLTGAWARENTREAIYEAFEQRRVFATTGLRPVLVFRVCDVLMGGTAASISPPEVEIHVECDHPVESIEFIRDGHIVHQHPCSSPTVSYVWTDTDCPAGEHFYYAHVKFEGDELALPWNLAPVQGVHAWSSPVWVVRG